MIQKVINFIFSWLAARKWSLLDWKTQLVSQNQWVRRILTGLRMSLTSKNDVEGACNTTRREKMPKMHVPLIHKSCTQSISMICWSSIMIKIMNEEKRTISQKSMSKSQTWSTCAVFSPNWRRTIRYSMKVYPSRISNTSVAIRESSKKVKIFASTRKFHQRTLTCSKFSLIQHLMIVYEQIVSLWIPICRLANLASF